MTKLLQYFICVMGTCLALTACVREEVKVTTGNVSDSDSDQRRGSSASSEASKARLSAEAHAELAMAYFQRARLGVALDEANIAIQSDPTYARGYLAKGIVYDVQDLPNQARPAFDEAGRLAPNDPEVGSAYGWFLCAHGQAQTGFAWLEKSARNPYNTKPALAWRNAGACMQDFLKDEAGSEERFLRAVQADPMFVDPQLRLAGLAYRTQRYVRAKQFIDRVQQLMKTPGPDVLWLAASIEKKLGNEDTVRVYGNRLKKDFPASNEYQYFLQGKFQ